MSVQNIALLNFFLCSGIMWACICRLNSQPSKIHRAVRAKYVALFTGAMIHGLQPTLMGTWPTWSGVSISAAMLLFLGLSLPRWKKPYDPELMGDRRMQDANQ